MAMKWNLFMAAVFLTGYLLLSHGAPLLPVMAGAATAGGVGFIRRKR
jgi:hypothetical protein